MSSEQGKAIEDERKRGEKSRDEIEGLRLKSALDVVRKVHISVLGNSFQVRVLYLTDKQAEKFEPDTLPRVLAAMEIPKPKLVIKLVRSLFGTAFYNSY